jgi:transposase
MLRCMADAEAWSKRVAEWRASGLTAKEFCAKHDLRLSALRNWTYRLRAAEKVSEPGAMRLIPVTVKPSNAPASTPQTPQMEPTQPALTVELGAARIVVPAGVDRATLKMVLDALGEHAVRGAR